MVEKKRSNKAAAKLKPKKGLNKVKKLKNLKVKSKPFNKKDSDILGIDIANNAAIKRRKIEEKNKVKNVKKCKLRVDKVNLEKKQMSYSRYKVKRYLSRILLLIIICTISISLVIVIDNKHILGITLKSEVDKNESILIELATGNNEVYSYQNELLIYSSGIIKTYSKYGKKTWDYKFEEMFSPSITSEGKYLQVVNKDSGYIYIFENKYEVARIKIEGDIKSANINENGDTAVLYSSPGVKAAISIYSKKGKEVYKLKLANDNVVNFNLSENLKYLAFTEVVMQGISITENINIVDITKSNNIQTIKNITSEIVYGLDIVGDNLDIITDMAVYRYDTINKKFIEEKLDNKNIMFVDYVNKKLAFISKKADSDAKSQLVTKSIKNEKERVVEIEEVPKDFKYTNNLSYIIYQKRIDIYNNFGKKVKVYKSDNMIINTVIFNSGKSIAIPYSNKIEIINI